MLQAQSTIDFLTWVVMGVVWQMQTKADRYRRVAWKMLLVGCRSSGAAFIKWGQWSATRSDIFPEVRERQTSLLHLAKL